MRCMCLSGTTVYSRSRPSGCCSCLARGIWLVRGDRQLKLFTLLGLAVTLIGLAFYIWGPGVDRNYGGNASAFRWAFWMAPLWLGLMLPAVDLMSRSRWSRGVALVLLAFSGLACNYPTWTPWSPTWIMNFMGYMGWL